MADLETPGSASPDFVQSLARGLAVIRVFDADHPTLTSSDVARLTGFTRATARRLLMTLVELGYVRSDGRHFTLRPTVLELGYAFLSGLGLPEVARPHLEQLAHALNETCSLAVLDDDDIVYVARVSSRRIMRFAISVGSRFPAYATTMGRVLLAAQPDEWLDDYLDRTDLRPFTARTVTDPDRFRSGLTRIRRQGHAVADQELEDGIRSLAVPVRDADGTVAAAMNVSVQTGRGTISRLRKELLPPLLDCARAVEDDLAGGRARDRRPG